jgi:hypothetical protein
MGDYALCPVYREHHKKHSHAASNNHTVKKLERF